MDGTTALAIWGAVTGTASVGLQGGASYRDRVNLNVNVRCHNSETEHVLLIEVSNRGRQPTTIIEVGFLIKAEVTYELIERKIVNTAPFKIRWDDGTPVMLKPGELHQFAHDLTDWPDPMIHADSPMRSYAVDSHGRKSWGSPSPFLRMMMGWGWQPKGVVDTRLVEPMDEPLIAEPVTPRWKLWKPKGERLPQTWDPSEIKVALNRNIKRN